MEQRLTGLWAMQTTRPAEIAPVLCVALAAGRRDLAAAICESRALAVAEVHGLSGCVTYEVVFEWGTLRDEILAGLATDRAEIYALDRLSRSLLSIGAADRAARGPAAALDVAAMAEAEVPR